MLEPKRYSSDLRNAEWERVLPLMPARKARGRQREVDERELLNAIFYLLNNGCKWRELPQEFPAWQTVYKYFRRWQRLGVWQEIHARLRAEVRTQVGKTNPPSVGIIDSQAVKTTEKREPAPCGGSPR